MKINLTFSFESRLKIPKIKIGLDETILYQGDVQSTMELSSELQQGRHIFYIEHYGKTKHEASVKGIDKHVQIEKIYFDDVSLEEQLWEGKFFPNYLHNSHNEPEFICPNLYLGHNGKWTYEFDYPFVTWLIKKRRPGPNLKNTIFETDENQLLEIKKYFENIKD